MIKVYKRNVIALFLALFSSVLIISNYLIKGFSGKSMFDNVIGIFVLFYCVFLIASSLKIYPDKITEGFISVKFDDVQKVSIAYIMWFEGIIFELKNGRGYLCANFLFYDEEEIVYNVYEVINNNYLIEFDSEYIKKVEKYKNIYKK